MSHVAKCRGVRKAVGAYGSGELGTRSRQVVEGHITSCSPCRFFVERQARLERLLGSLASSSDDASAEPPSWEQFRPILFSAVKAGSESRFARVWEGIRARLADWLVPKTALHLSQGLYLAKRAAVPALGVFVAFAAYCVFTGERAMQREDGGVQVAQASPSLLLHVQFQPGEAGGMVSGGNARQEGVLRYGWK
ncbi:MAG: zf-HC2 domain-containing protein [Candidatus Aureabacteria bacterium]|nr:zf-HC2 domain-containing protein [Candidatus Auribacterota bacterium]